MFHLHTWRHLELYIRVQVKRHHARYERVSLLEGSLVRGWCGRIYLSFIYKWFGHTQEGLREASR